MKKVNVLIVGLGPTGMALGCELQKHNINYMIVDKRTAVSTINRAVNVTPATLAILRYSLKLDVAVKAKKTEGIKLFLNNKAITDIGYQEMGFPYKKFYYYTQPKLENNLVSFLKNEFVFEKTLLKKVIRKNAGYHALLNDAQTGVDYWVSCDYLIGCDGNNSLTREFLTKENEQEKYGFGFLLFDVEFDRFYTNESLYYVYEDGYVIVVPVGKNKYRIIVSSLCFDFKDPLKYNSIAFIKKHLDNKLQVDVPNIINLMWFTHADFGHRISSLASNDNCFICGDAYHVFSPVGGLNLNTGIHDAINLGWKLAYVINGYADGSLLNSYQNERNTAIYRIRDKTRYLTYAIVDVNNYMNSTDYSLNIKNPAHFKLKLSYMLSGYDRYSKSHDAINGSSMSSGCHISEFIKSKKAYEIFCDSIDATKINVIMGENIKINNDINIDFVRFSFQKKNIVNKNTWVMIRPDGYIFHVGDKKDFSITSDLLSKCLAGVMQ